MELSGGSGFDAVLCNNAVDGVLMDWTWVEIIEVWRP
jgi:hypothetical protein